MRPLRLTEAPIFFDTVPKYSDTSLDALTKFRKATIRFAFLYVRPSVRMRQLGSHWTDFQEI